MERLRTFMTWAFRRLVENKISFGLGYNNMGKIYAFASYSFHVGAALASTVLLFVAVVNFKQYTIREILYYLSTPVLFSFPSYLAVLFYRAIETHKPKHMKFFLNVIVTEIFFSIIQTYILTNEQRTKHPTGGFWDFYSEKLRWQIKVLGWSIFFQIYFTFCCFRCYFKTRRKYAAVGREDTEDVPMNELVHPQPADVLAVDGDAGPSTEQQNPKTRPKAADDDTTSPSSEEGPSSPDGHSSKVFADVHKFDSTAPLTPIDEISS